MTTRLPHFALTAARTLAMATLIFIAQPPAHSAANDCTMLTPNPPAFLQHGIYAVPMSHKWVRFGAGVAASCTTTSSNAKACSVRYGTLLRAKFEDSTNTTAMACMFDCGVRGTCTIRGGVGLPVELLSFGVE
ncbi:MAG: hypothetical protein ACI8TX_000555 [Hyphomicrobiaceae bacterium]|jgi:hypothetical protein